MAKKKLKLLTEQELRVKLEELKTSSDDNIKRMVREFEKALDTGFENLDLVIGAISMVILAGAGMMHVEELIVILSMLGIAIAIIPFNIIKTKLTNQKKFLRGRLKPDETVKRYYAAVDYLLACEGIADTVVLESFLPEIDTCDEFIEEQVILLESILGAKVDKNKLADPEYAKQLAKQIKETPTSEYSKRENIHALIELLSILSLISVVTMPLFLLALAILPKLESNVTKEAELSKVTKCIDKLISKCGDPEQKKKLIDNKKYFENKELVAKNIPADKNSSSKGKYINQRYYITEDFGVLSLAGCVIDDIQSGDVVDFDKFDKWFKDDSYPVEWIEQLTRYQNIAKILDNNKAQADAEYVENIPKLKDKHVSELMYNDGDEIIYCHEDNCCYAFNLKYIDDEPPVKISLSAIVQAASKTAADYKSLKSKYVTESIDYKHSLYPVLEAPQDEEDDEDTPTDYTADVDDDETEDDESAEDFTSDVYDGEEAPEDDESEDEDDEPEDFTADAEDGGEPAEAPEDSEAEPVSDEGDEPVEDEEDTPEDFTDDATGEETGEEEPEGGEFDGEEPSEDEAPADFTDDVSGEGEETPEDGDEPTIDDSGETTDDMASEDPNEINLDNSSIRNYNLMIDFQKLYKNLEDILTHLNNVSYTTSIQNSVRDRCMDNLTRLKGEVYSYIDQYYSKDFKVNIYYYTTYIQALKINLEMLHKNSVMLDKDSKQ